MSGAELDSEAEVLAAVAAADEAHQQCTTQVKAHEKEHTGGRRAIAKRFPRIPIEHDLPEEQEMRTKCPTPHPLERIGHGLRECYRYEAPKISVEKHIRWTYICRSPGQGRGNGHGCGTSFFRTMSLLVPRRG